MSPLLKICMKDFYPTYKVILIIIIYFFPSSAKSQEVSVSIYNDRKLQAVNFSVQKGDYYVYNGNEIKDSLIAADNISVFLDNGLLIYNNKGLTFASNKEITLKNKNESSFFVNYPGSVEIVRSYEGWVKFKKSDNRLLLINFVPLESYVAAVVEAEGGYNAGEQFYMVQAILSRTYALRNINRHIDSGFELCDGTHCQVYKFKCTNKDILNASKKTKNLILVDNDFNPALALFHSNSGGRTANSGDVFVKNLPYLKAIEDTFAVHGRNYSWETSMSVLKWKEYLQNRGIKNVQELDLEDILIKQHERGAFFRIGEDSIKLSSIRHDLGLRSAYFTMRSELTNIIFEGKGYGHGVGLSQESAIEMARRGYNYEQIIKHFFKSVNIVNINVLSVFNTMQSNIENEKPD